MRGFTDTLLMIPLNLFSSSSSGYSLLAACYLEISASLAAMSGQGWKTDWYTFFTWAKINSCLDFISFSSSWRLECKIICISIWTMQKSHVCLCVCVYMCARMLSCSVVAWLFVTSWTVAHQTPLSMRFSRQAYQSGLPFPSTGDLPDPGFEPRCPALQADFYHLNHQENQWSRRMDV